MSWSASCNINVSLSQSAAPKHPFQVGDRVRTLRRLYLLGKVVAEPGDVGVCTEVFVDWAGVPHIDWNGEATKLLGRFESRGSVFAGWRATEGFETVERLTRVERVLRCVPVLRRSDDSQEPAHAGESVCFETRV